MMFTVDFDHPMWVHFMGIGGISMSSLAQYLLSRGFKVTGSDKQESKNTRRLRELGAEITIGQRPENILPGMDFAVNTAAVHADNPEYKAAVSAGLPILTRAQLLGQMMAQYPVSFGISGTHGKTTTTGMVTDTLLAAGVDPTASIGGLQDSIGGNLRIGHTDYFVAEACEFTNSFLEMYPHSGIILNVEADHLEFFGNLENIRRSFRKYAENIPADGHLIINSAIRDVKTLMDGIACKMVLVGDKEEDDYRAANITQTPLGLCSYDMYCRKKLLGRVNLRVAGEHNVYNSLAAAAAAMEEGFTFETVKRGLESFRGVHRRFEHRGVLRENIVVMDDFGHHPDEIAVTLGVARHYPYRLTAVFQPYTYSRTKNCFDEFVDVLSRFDRVVLADILPARETDTLGMHSELLLQEIRRCGTECYYFPSFQEIEKFLLENSVNGDMLITMGCGDVDKVADALVASDLCTSSTDRMYTE